jgi:hypothetical protein|uniref:hypothetical protein n=1 Tax=Prosthecobacter sp. TaxID=1965333 RepID=UPI0037844476
MPGEETTFHTVFNHAEAGLWFVIALILAFRGRRQRPWSLLLPPAFGVFGISDLIEAQTGAWWEPWWLFVMKAACVLVFVLAWRAYRRQGRPHG